MSASLFSHHKRRGALKNSLTGQYFMNLKKCSSAVWPDRAKNKNLSHLFKETHKNKTTSSIYPVNSKKDRTLNMIFKTSTFTD